MGNLAKHTPGPWPFQGVVNVAYANYYAIDFPDGSGFLVNCQIGEANARLIAAAPDLLAELEVREGDLVMLKRAIEEGDPKAELLVRVSDMLRETRAAIAKAEGRTNA